MKSADCALLIVGEDGHLADGNQGLFMLNRISFRRQRNSGSPDTASFKLLGIASSLKITFSGTAIQLPPSAKKKLKFRWSRFFRSAADLVVIPCLFHVG